MEIDDPKMYQDIKQGLVTCKVLKLLFRCSKRKRKVVKGFKRRAKEKEKEKRKKKRKGKRRAKEHAKETLKKFRRYLKKKFNGTGFTYYSEMKRLSIKPFFIDLFYYDITEKGFDHYPIKKNGTLSKSIEDVGGFVYLHSVSEVLVPERFIIQTSYDEKKNYKLWKLKEDALKIEVEKGDCRCFLGYMVKAQTNKLDHKCKNEKDFRDFILSKRTKVTLKNGSMPVYLNTCFFSEVKNIGEVFSPLKVVLAKYSKCGNLFNSESTQTPSSKAGKASGWIYFLKQIRGTAKAREQYYHDEMKKKTTHVGQKRATGTRPTKDQRSIKKLKK